MSFDCIVREEGGRHNRHNIIASKNRCDECLRRGPKYYKVDEFSKGLTFAFIREGFSSTTRNMWETRSTADGSAASSAAGAGDDSGLGPGVLPKKADPGHQPRERTELEKAMAAATKSKGTFAEVETSLKDLKDSFAKDSTYSD